VCIALFCWSGGQSCKEMICYHFLTLEVGSETFLECAIEQMLMRDELPVGRIVMLVYGDSCDWKFLDSLFTRKGTALVTEVCRRHIYTGIYHHPPYVNSVVVHSLLDRANYK